MVLGGRFREKGERDVCECVRVCVEVHVETHIHVHVSTNK